MNKYFFTTEIAQLINPPLHSKFFEKCKDSLENVYSSRRNALLSCVTTPRIARSNAEIGFGISTAKGVPAIDLMFPSESKMSQSVYANDFSYKRCNDSIKSSGVKSKNLDNSGEQVKELLNYNRNKHLTVLLPYSDVKKIHCDHRENDAFDNPDEKFDVDENRMDSKTKKSKKGLMDKNVIEMVWNLLKIKNHENFQDIVSAFKAYKNENGKIMILDLQKMCQKFGISVPIHVLEKLLEKCEIIDEDGMLSYEEFMHALNWKDLHPENHNFKNINYKNDWKEGINNLSKTITDDYKTTAAVIGDHKYTVNSKTAGLPSHRNNINKLTGVSEFKECGNASSAMQPNAFIKYGVFEEDLNKLYSKEEIKSHLRNSGIKFNDRTFEIVWQNVNYSDKASIGEVWCALKNNCLSSNQY